MGIYPWTFPLLPRSLYTSLSPIHQDGSVDEALLVGLAEEYGKRFQVDDLEVYDALREYWKNLANKSSFATPATGLVSVINPSWHAIWGEFDNEFSTSDFKTSKNPAGTRIGTCTSHHTCSRATY